ncbi:MAG: hypothetical protein JJU11_17460 [Candidatus Sumerlaeia bacterium]|nr:hypothetical protein [Candidatus Sumerlaeia bacterium]
MTIWEPRRADIKERETSLHCYLITGPKGECRLAPERIAQLIRGHWGIENRHFHVKDRTLREDDQRVRSGAMILMCLRSIATTALQRVRLAGKRSCHVPETRIMLNARKSRLQALVMRPLR